MYEDTNAAHQLTSLLRLLARGRHEWIILPGDVAVAVSYVERNDPTALQVMAELARKASVRDAWGGVEHRVRKVTITKEHLADDLSDLEQPAYLVVENELSDGAFLRSVCHVFAGDDVLGALDAHHVELVHSGGANQMPKFAEARASRFRRTVRVALFLDSDRYLPGQETKSHRLAKEAAELGVRTHVLSLREIENYVPNRVLSSLRPRGKFSALVDAVKQLTPEQRGHLDMKYGFGHTGDGKAQAPHPKHEGLYDDLSPRVRDVLRTGFGRDLVRELEEMAENRALTVRDFGGEDSGTAQELRALLAMLREII
ncbi:hypothetical protein ACFWTE_23035 [Nocardiopsis sp. NPDC058631]|uniref:hypothetical protein n=1 Tax=Nocardiopsis sp. NPDC058631 TaxID=3346566 RepID=UPI003666549F